jgi:diguanylate cyclase (GGDEF)-like protein
MFREDIESLREAAVRDDLTGLYNRRSYNMILKRLLETGEDGPAEKFALILCDVDRFKQVNDRLGHSKGDRVLVDIADVLRSATREVDFAFRFGGDEFMVLLPNCGEKQASEVAGRLRNYEYAHPKLDKPVTMSTGIAEYPRDGETPDELLRQADDELYQSKHQSR